MHRNRESKARQRIISFHKFDKQHQKILDFLVCKYGLSYSMLYAINKYDFGIVPEFVKFYVWNVSHVFKENEYELQGYLNDIHEDYAYVSKIKLDIWKPKDEKLWEYKLQGTASIPHWIEFDIVARNIPYIPKAIYP